MIANIFNRLFFNPLYNLLIIFSVFLPGRSLGGAIIVLTLVVKLALLPFQHRALRLQKKMKQLEPELKSIKKLHSDDRQEQARKTIELYRAHGLNPLATFWTILIQIPIILALFWVFRDTSVVHYDRLYSFTPRPETLPVLWLGLIDLSRSFWPLSLLVGLTQFVQLKLASPPPSGSETPSSETDPRAEFGRRLQRQMRYFLPVFLVFVSSSLPAAIALYWVTSNLFAVGHEWFIRREARPLSRQSETAGSSAGR